MTIVDIRDRLAEGKATIGTWLQFPATDVAEMMAKAGYDWVAVDMEHGSFGINKLPDIFRAIECGGAVPFARLPEASKVWIKSALDAGAQGLIFPMIENRVQLDQAIDLSVYPGQDFWRDADSTGRSYRGVGFSRANGFGQDFEYYMNNLAARIFLVAQIEHIKAVENLEEIVGHSRLDAIMVGPYDLSGSMGLTGKFEEPRFLEAMTRVSDICKKHGIRMGTHIVEPNQDKLQQEIDKGCKFIAYGVDTVFLWKAAKIPSVTR